MAKDSDNKTICALKHEMLQGYFLNLSDSDIYLLDSKPFIRTLKVAELLRVSPHTFSNDYVPVLVSKGIARFVLGRYKFYDLRAILSLIKKSVENGKSLIQICNEKPKNKLLRKRDKNGRK